MTEYDLRRGYLWENEEFVRWVARCRGLKLQVALIAYRLDHGDYPSRLEDLVPEYLDQLPDDPYGEGTFRYEAAGFDGVLGYGYDPDPNRSSPLQSIPAHEPVLWSPGLENRRIEKLTTAAKDRSTGDTVQSDQNRDAEGGPRRAVFWLRGQRDDPFGAMIFPLPPRK
jgi:hypothetical protein